MFQEFQQFREPYISECLELLADMEVRLLRLSDSSADPEELNAILRCAHSIKGGAGAFGFTPIGELTHLMETMLEQLRDGRLAMSEAIIDSLLAARDATSVMLLAARGGKETTENTAIAARLAQLCNLPPRMAAESPPAPSPAAGKRTYRITFTPHRQMIAHGNDPLLLLRELQRLGRADITADSSALPPLAQLECEQCYLSWRIVLESEKSEAAIREVFEFAEGECTLSIALQEKPEPPVEKPLAAAAPPTIRVDIDKLDRLINMVGEIIIVQAMLSLRARLLPPHAYPELVQGISDLASHTRELQDAVMSVRMQPVRSLFSRLPRLVRDVAAQLGKNVRILMSGEDTEIDKTIVEQLVDPLMHMIRNAIDHGIELPDIRLRAGKPAQGTLRLSASHRGGRIVIELADDGHGIDRARVLEKARKKGIVAPDAEPEAREIDQLIFAPGFSTAEQVTAISGRGVGMDVVKRNIESLGGTVTLSNRPGEGMQFSISLPLTLAVLDGMIVRVGAEHYIIPISTIMETLWPAPGRLKTTAAGGMLLELRGEYVPVICLRALLGVGDAGHAEGLIVVVENEQAAMGLRVDDLIGQQQVVIKTLETNSIPVAGIAGATILGDGKVSLILDIGGICRMAHHPRRRMAA